MPASSPAGFVMPSNSPARIHVSMFRARSLFWKLMTASVPASPAILGPLVKPPLASRGILNPNSFPARSPRMGQSGALTWMLLIAPMTALTGVLTSPTIPEKMLPNMSTASCHRFPQFKVNTSLMKVRTPWKISCTVCTMELMPALNASNPPSSAGTTTLAILKTTVMMF